MAGGYSANVPASVPARLFDVEEPLAPPVGVDLGAIRREADGRSASHAARAASQLVDVPARRQDASDKKAIRADRRKSRSRS